jgi:DNA-binding GntR family transcriptional regulator
MLHFALVSACGSLWQFRRSLYDHTERYRNIPLLRHEESAARVRTANAEPQYIMPAALARDQRKATLLLGAHLLETERAVSAILQDAPVATHRL